MIYKHDHDFKFSNDRLGANQSKVNSTCLCFTNLRIILPLVFEKMLQDSCKEFVTLLLSCIVADF